jgi:hypothetical protein
MSDKAKYGYFAGILDGEGCLSITVGHKETCTNYNATMQVQNTSKPLIDWLQKKFGGSVYLSKKATEKTKEAYMWRVLKKKEIEILLLATLPYLVVKREQAKILLDFVRLTSEANTDLRAAYFQRLRVLNSRGVSVTTNMQDVCNHCGETSHYHQYDGSCLMATTKFQAKIESELHGDMQSEPSVN